MTTACCDSTYYPIKSGAQIAWHLSLDNTQDDAETLAKPWLGYQGVSVN